MQNLKNKILFIIIHFIFLSGCQNSPKFMMIADQNDELHVIKTNRNRIIHECKFLNAEKENNWRHQYVLYLLTDKNEVLPIFFPTNQDQTDCLEHLNKVENILKNNNQIKMCVRDQIERMPNDNSVLELHNFGTLGSYVSNYYALTFDTICNPTECHSISDTWTNTCTDFKK